LALRWGRAHIPRVYEAEAHAERRARVAHTPPPPGKRAAGVRGLAEPRQREVAGRAPAAAALGGAARYGAHAAEGAGWDRA
jgi:hypothetical protein